MEDYNHGLEIKEKFFYMLNLIADAIAEAIKQNHLDLQSKTALSTKMNIYLNSLTNLMTRYQSRNYKSFLTVWKKFTSLDSTEERYLSSQGISLFLNYYIDKVDESSSK